MKPAPKVLLIGLSALSYQRAKPLLESHQLPGLLGPKHSARFCATTFVPPSLHSAWWTTVATGWPTHVHGVWREFSPPSPGLPGHIEQATIWQRFEAEGWSTAVIRWPGQESPGQWGRWRAGSAFFRGGDAGNALLSVGDFRIEPGQVHPDVLSVLVPRWREATPKQQEALDRLRHALAVLYSSLHATKAALLQFDKRDDSRRASRGLFIALHNDFLGFVRRAWRDYTPPRSSQIDGHDWNLFGGLPERALGLLDLLVSELLLTAGAEARAIILFEPEMESPSLDLIEGVQILRGPWGPSSPDTKSIRAEDVAGLLCSHHQVSPRSEPSSPQALTVLAVEETFHGGVAFAAAGLWREAQPLLERAWSSLPENHLHGLELARANSKLGQTAAAGRALETALDFYPLPSFASELNVLRTEDSHAPAAENFEVRRPREDEAHRFHFLAGEPVGFSGPLIFLALVSRQHPGRMVGGAVLEDVRSKKHGEARVFLGSRWQRDLSLIQLLIDGVRAEAGTLKWELCRLEILSNDKLAKSVAELGHTLFKHEECWRVPHETLYARAKLAWTRIKGRDKTEFVGVSGHPEDRLWLEALEIARAHRIQSRFMNETLTNPRVAKRVFSPQLCHFILHGTTLAAVLLPRLLSPTRVFADLRAVAPQFLCESRLLNTRLLLNGLEGAQRMNIQDHEMVARWPQEAETITMARRSQGVRFQYHHIFDIQTASR